MPKGQVVNASAAKLVLQRAASVADDENASVDPLWEARARELSQWTSNRVAIAAYGAALLAKATNADVDALSVSPKSGRNGYSARSVAKLLAEARDQYRFSLGTNGSDPLAASPFFGEQRIDRITKWRKPMRKKAGRLVGWLGSLTHPEAELALVAFLRVRMEQQARSQALRSSLRVSGVAESLAELVATVKPFIEADPEDGSRGAAVVAAAFAASGREVVARPVNDPGQVDVDVLRDDALEIGVEVKQKPATAQDALDIAQGAEERGASKAVLCAFEPEQATLDDERLIARADEEHSICLQIIYSVGDLFRLALFGGGATRDEFMASFAEEASHYFAELNVSEEGREQWQTAVNRWGEDAG